jgi:hypothetical protein
MDILFCSSPDMRKAPTFEAEREYEAAQQHGFRCHLMGFEDFLDGRDDRALEFLRPANGITLLYRGWIFREEEHVRLTAALAQRGYSLFTKTHAYAEALYFPNYYPMIAELAPRAAWSEGRDLEAAWRAARSLGRGPWIVKDYVKSVKHRWETACYLPENGDRDSFDTVCGNILKFQGSRFERGFVFREFLPLKIIGESGLGYPMCEEYRLFFFRKRLLLAAPYHRSGGTESDFSQFEKYAERFASEFLTIDVGKSTDGRWLILDVGDGGVSGIPPRVSAERFYDLVKLMMV